MSTPHRCAPLALFSLLLFRCGPAEVAFTSLRPPSAEIVPIQSRNTLPTSADALVLLVRLSDEGAEVHGTVLADLSIDLDEADDEKMPFRYRVLDAVGTPLYARSDKGPVYVREFLAYYGEMSGFSILDVYPELGDFALVVPKLEGAQTVELQIWDEERLYHTVGTYDLRNAEEDDKGLSESVVDWETLYESGSDAQRLDIVLVGDGYRETELEKWRADADMMSDKLLATQPLAQYSDLINIHRVDAVSAESGASFDCTDDCDFRDTAFGTVFALEFVNWLLGTEYRTSTVFQQQQWEVARAVSVVPWDMVVVVANTTHDGGFAMHYATVPLGSDATWPDTGVHELAHVLGLLGDEYNQDVCVPPVLLDLPPNITDQPESPHWMHWIDDGVPLPTPEVGFETETGAFVGAFNCDDLARPNQTCRMNNSSFGDFCPVCSEALVRRIFHFADAVHGVDTSVSDDGWQFSPDAVVSVDATWYLDGELWASTGSDESLQIPRDSLEPGIHSLQVNFEHRTELVLDAGEDLSERYEWILTIH